MKTYACDLCFADKLPSEVTGVMVGEGERRHIEPCLPQETDRHLCYSCLGQLHLFDLAGVANYHFPEPAPVAQLWVDLGEAGA